MQRVSCVAGMASMKAAGELDDDESEDEDFDIKGKEDDEGEPTDESEAESGDAEMVDEDRPKVTLMRIECMYARMQQKLSRWHVICLLYRQLIEPSSQSVHTNLESHTQLCFKQHMDNPRQWGVPVVYLH